MTDDAELITCPQCDGKKSIPGGGYNPSTGNHFSASKLCPTCEGNGRIHQSEYPWWLTTPTKRSEPDKDDPWA